VDPYYLEDLISTYSNVTFVLMHGGQDFSDGTSEDVPFYNGTMFDHTLELMSQYDNTVLEISAMLASTAPPNEGYRNPLAFENLVKAVDAGMQDRMIYGSDANQFPGGISSYLMSTVESLIAAGLSDEERCAILVDLPKEVYKIPDTTPETAAPSSVDTPGSSDLTKAPSTTTTSGPTSAPTSSAVSARVLHLSGFITAVSWMTHTS
jgi:predicted TIM-barrel fold metal-dependent hydrolase